MLELPCGPGRTLVCLANATGSTRFALTQQLEKREENYYEQMG